MGVRWEKQRRGRFPGFWLGDHGQDRAGLDPARRQRRVDTVALGEDVQGRAASVLDEGRGLAVAWPDGGADSRYSADFRATMAGLLPEALAERPGLAPRLWSAE